MPAAGAAERSADHIILVAWVVKSVAVEPINRSAILHVLRLHRLHLPAAEERLPAEADQLKAFPTDEIAAAARMTLNA